ncbi:MAG: uroporphyrinogen-III synthase [Chlamydiales bacterium]
MKSLYLGLRLTPHLFPHTTLVHYPLIETKCRPKEDLEVKKGIQLIRQISTHLIFTSRTTVFYLNQLIGDELSERHLICVGKGTAKALEEKGLHASLIAYPETAEGVVWAFKKNPPKNRDVYVWPHSSLARTVISDYFKERECSFYDFALYDTVPIKPSWRPNLEDYHEVIFTSPSTVDAFLQLFTNIPLKLKLTAIGPITKSHLNNMLREFAFY